MVRMYKGMFLRYFWSGLILAVSMCVGRASVIEQSMSRCQIEQKTSEQKGFTIAEILGVVAIIGLVLFLGVPLLNNFSARDNDGGAATRLAHNFNLTKDQARRRNRAYIVDLEFGLDTVGGIMTVSESRRPSCRATVEEREAGNTAVEIISEFAFGVGGIAEWEKRNPGLTYRGSVERHVGLTGWSQNGGVDLSTNLSLCINPDGSLTTITEESIEPLAGRLTLKVQKFALSGGTYAPQGPHREVEFSFAGPARMILR